MAGITHQLSRSFGIYGYAGYDRLIGDAADSPIVRLRGSPDQFSGGVALYFSFNLGSRR
jgi:outer membrane protein